LRERIAALIASFRADGRPISPTELFGTDADWLSTLSARCCAELKLHDLPGVDETWLHAGTESKQENYHLLYPGPDGLRVIFPPYAVAPYAVAPYAVGVQEILIPYRDLSEVLNPDLFGVSAKHR
jgi:hypothetical protein